METILIAEDFISKRTVVRAVVRRVGPGVVGRRRVRGSVEVRHRAGRGSAREEGAGRAEPIATPEAAGARRIPGLCASVGSRERQRTRARFVPSRTRADRGPRGHLEAASAHQDAAGVAPDRRPSRPGCDAAAAVERRTPVGVSAHRQRSAALNTLYVITFEGITFRGNPFRGNDFSRE